MVWVVCFTGALLALHVDYVLLASCFDVLVFVGLTACVIYNVVLCWFNCLLFGLLVWVDTCWLLGLVFFDILGDFNVLCGAMRWFYD